MAIPAYMTIVGVNQGVISEKALDQDSVGTAAQSSHTDQIMVLAFSHDMELPYNIQSGQATAQRIHHPVRITKMYDRTSPLLANALNDGELLDEVEIKWYRNDGKTELVHYYTTTLHKAVIVKITDYMHHCQDPDNVHFTHQQDISFRYQKITWTHHGSGTTGSDDWSKPRT